MRKKDILSNGFVLYLKYVYNVELIIILDELPNCKIQIISAPALPYHR